jgi:hypothetical protein
MKGDFTRLSYDSSKGYARVLKQQGRVDLDADWNVAEAIQAYLDQILVKDVVGPCGVPKKNAGFLVEPVPGGDLTLSRGRIYVGGLLCETQGTTYNAQPHLPNPPSIEAEEGRVDLVYLDVWQRHITAIEDRDLLEEALGGADTTTRLQTVWQVKVRLGVEQSECDGEFEPWPPLPPLDQRGRLTTSTTTTPDESDPCLIAPGGGYHGLENRLYRVEIHDGGQPYTWPRPAGVVATEVTAVSNGTDVTVADWTLEGHAWQVGQSVELYSQESDAAGAAGILARVAVLDEANATLILSVDVSSMAGHTNLRLRRVATFKWSRDNGSVVFAIEEFVSGQPTKVRVKRLGRDQVLTLHANDYVEILGDETELKGRPGTLAAIAPGGIDEVERMLTLDRDVSGHDGEERPKVRRWDQKSEAVAVTAEPLTLEDGVQIQFGGQDLITGDYWTFAARTATGRVDELVDAPPQGIAHYYCRLALIGWETEGGATRALIGIESGEPVPDLAIAWEVSEDGKEWVLKLADDVVLPGGDPLTAAHVAEILAEYGYEVEVIDDFALRLFDVDQERFIKLSEIPIIEAEGLEAHVEDCRPDFPSLTEICAEDVCYDDSRCDAIHAETVQEALDQLCAMRDLRHHNKHLHGWGIVCGLQVHCGPDDPERPGDRLTVTVRPGYAIDCEGNDIVLDEEVAVPVLQMIEEWDTEHEGEPLLDNGKGIVCLVIERDEHGQPRVVLRPYDPGDDTRRAMLEGTLLMDFVQDCISDPLKEIIELLSSPPVDDPGRLLVSPAQRQIITLLNLIIQLWNPEHGAHVYLSAKEHKILHDLYLALRGILQSKTFCAMFDAARPFPDYPFENAQMSTLFGLDRGQTRLRVRPDGALGYSLGLDNQIHVYDLQEEELVTVLEVPGGEGLVARDVAFSQDSKQLYAIATLHDTDSIFAVADVDGIDHSWRPVNVLCGVQLLTLARAPRFKDVVFAVGRGEGLFTIKLGDVQPHIEPSLGFNAVGHLVVDPSTSRAYASAANEDASSDAYDRVYEIDLAAARIIAHYPLRSDNQFYIGQDDIAIVPAGAGRNLVKLYVVADLPEEGGKQLFIFPVQRPSSVPTTLSVPDTAIRLGHVPGSNYLMGTLEDHYLVGLVDVVEDQAVGGFQLPVQIAPIAIAVDPEGGWVYVVNSLSPTITKVAARYMKPLEVPGDEDPSPGSPQFLQELMRYRQEVFMAFIDLTGGLLQHLKDCFCHHLLVDCPECKDDDELYLGSVKIEEGEVYSVCNFSRRKYVKSFPTVGYWLSLIPVAPLIHKAVEYLCCMVLPQYFGRFAPPEAKAYQPLLKSRQLRTGYAAYRRTDFRAQANEMVRRFNLTQRVAADWADKAIAQAAAPMEPKAAVTGEDVLDQPVEEALKRAKQAQVEAKVETYDRAQGAKNLLRIAQAPLRVPAGSRVTFYEQDGVVRYYALTEKPPEAVEAIRTELEAQKATLAEVETLKTRLSEMQRLLASKDQELTGMQGQLQALEEKQAKLETAPELAKVAAMEAELKDLRTFRDEVKLFMKRSNE